MLGIISDIHANLEALESVLRDGDELGIQDWICLGDIVGYGADPEACIEVVRSRCKIIIMGNHDEAASVEANPDDFNPVARQAIIWTKYTVSDSNRLWLRSLPLDHQEGNRLYVHSSPRDPGLWNYIFTESEARRQMTVLDESVKFCFIGHSHETFRYVDSNGTELINVGSVGQPRDGDPRASYVIFRSDGVTEHRRVEYDVAKAQQKIIDAKLPAFLAERLQHGQ